MNDIIADERGLLAWKYTKKGKDGNEEEIIYTEELVAILLKYGRSLAEK